MPRVISMIASGFVRGVRRCYSFFRRLFCRRNITETPAPEPEPAVPEPVAPEPPAPEPAIPEVVVSDPAPAPCPTSAHESTGVWIPSKIITWTPPYPPIHRPVIKPFPLKNLPLLQEEESRVSTPDTPVIDDTAFLDEDQLTGIIYSNETMTDDDGSSSYDFVACQFVLKSNGELEMTILPDTGENKNIRNHLIDEASWSKAQYGQGVYQHPQRTPTKTPHDPERPLSATEERILFLRGNNVTTENHDMIFRFLEDEDAYRFIKYCGTKIGNGNVNFNCEKSDRSYKDLTVRIDNRKNTAHMSPSANMFRSVLDVIPPPSGERSEEKVQPDQYSQLSTRRLQETERTPSEYHDCEPSTSQAHYVEPAAEDVELEAQNLEPTTSRTSQPQDFELTTARTSQPQDIELATSLAQNSDPSQYRSCDSTRSPDNNQ